MLYHKLLQRQLKKYSGEELLSNEHFLRFAEAISDSYDAFDRDKELSDHAFAISQQEFVDINHQLKDEVDVRKLSVQKLRDTLNKIKIEKNEPVNQDDDLLEIVDLLNAEIAKRKEVEQQLLLAKEEAEKASNAKSDFLSIISHEIRTPLNAVIGMGHLLIKNNPKPEQINNLKALKTSSDNLLMLINDILDFSKIEAGKLDLEEVVFSIRKLTTDIVNANKNSADDRENQITLFIDDELPEYFCGDSLRIGQVLNNLISNAVKFTHKGLIKVSIKLLSSTDDLADVEIAIEDTGVGIADEQLVGIFSPFTQASSSITRQYGGTGLGLAITKKILGLLNSDIQVDSVLGEGSKFYFTLHLKIEANTVDDQSVEDNVDFDLKGKVILLVEDTFFNVLYATQLLEGWNAVIEVADNGSIAVDMVQQKKYDLVLMDLQMPVMDGYTATQKIREFNTTIPIIALTASATTNVREKVMHVGMQDYVTKPFNPDDFFIKIKKHIKLI